MLKEFKFLKKVSSNYIRDMMEIVDSMLAILVALDNGDYNDDTKKKEELITYVISLVNGQRQYLGRTIPGSWCVAPDDDDMPTDARIDFIFKPTYIACATLSRFLLEFPLYAISVENFKESLYTGMVFCSHRKLKGHGYEGDSGAIEALKILSLGKIPFLLNNCPSFCPQLKETIDCVVNDMAERLKNNTATGAWGEDISGDFRSVLNEVIHIK